MRGLDFEKPILDSVAVSKWKSERPVWRTVLNWKYVRRFVGITSIQDGFSGFLKHVGSLVRLLSPFELQNSFMELSFTFTLKSTMKTKLSLLLLYSSKTRFKHSRWSNLVYIRIVGSIQKPLSFFKLDLNYQSFNDS